MSISLATMIAVGLYVLTTAPFLPLMLFVHRLGGAYAGLFMAAMILQLVPIGLVFIPLGAVGVALLGFSLHRVAQRLKGFRRAGLPNPAVHERWSHEYLANIVALGLALEQKGAAWTFLEASRGVGFATFWTWIVPLSLVLWAWLAWLIVRERRHYAQVKAA